MSIKTGTKLGPYEIIAPLGAGGMGEVYRARDTRLDRQVSGISQPTGPWSDRRMFEEGVSRSGERERPI
jgi:serine/threonine protein kinase